MDHTEHQSNDDRRQARDLSLEPARPPAKVPGYQIQQFLGSGAFGEVWSATDLKTSRRVAIKFYTRRNRNDIQMLAREVEKLVVLEADRYVVQLLNVGWEADPPYYVMEYIEHGSLEDRLKSGFPMQVEQATDLFQEIATGMMHLHRKGIFHCDLKPGNILLDQDGHPRVADFGQSRLSTDETPALGTLFYMAPEQADMAAVPDASWDVYSLGCLLYSMLTGEPPYYSADLAAQIDTTEAVGDRLLKYRDSLFSAKKPTAHRKVAGVDRALADLIDRCIAADPKKRFNSIESVLAALETRDIARARRPLMLLGIIAPLLLLTVFGLFGTWASLQAITETNEAVAAKAIESNDYTARLLSRDAEHQIDEYFRSVTDLAYDPAFVAEFQRAMSDETLTQLRYQLADPADNSKLTELRQKYRQSATIRPLLKVVDERLANVDDAYPRAASWLIYDRLGNQVASAFPNENKTLGKNFSYRTYFSGASEDADFDDIPPVGPPPKSGQTNETPESSSSTARRIIDRPHLSTVFKSQQTKTWKVAFSAPIASNNQIVGVVVVTAELGDFVSFAAEDSRYWMLVDGREDGVLLDHPVYRDLKDQKKPVPAALSEVKINIDQASRVNRARPFETFEDPIGKLECSKDRNGDSKYDHKSIVSVEGVPMQPAISPLVSNDTIKKKVSVPPAFFVLVLHNQGDVFADVHALENRLFWLAVLASLTILLVLALLGYFVYRLLKESRSRLTQSSVGRLSETFSDYPTLKQEL
ncbi:protein kinase [Mariniblastus sp.]|nr:protein kinase [Mariniblastus sp.]